MEKHAAPPADFDFRVLAFNPDNIYSVRHKLLSFGIRNTQKLGALPKIMLTIYDEALLEKSKYENQSFYETYANQEYAHLYHTLNNLKVADVECYCQKGRAYNKPMFEKILGKTAPYLDDIMCYGNCKHTIFAAAKRQMKAAPTPDPIITQRFLQFAKRRIEEDIGSYLTHFSYSYADWYNHLTKEKQQDMDKVVTYLNPYKRFELSPEERRKIKRQAYEGICKIELQETNGKPRMVCSIPALTKFTMGPVTWQLEEICQEHLRGYCGGMNLTQMADKINTYIDQGFTKVVEGDGSAFDNTQDVTLKELDRYIYQRVAPRIYHVPRKLFMRTSQAYYKTMDIKYRKPHTNKLTTMMTYSVLGTVFSGDCDTTLCNTIRMAMYNIFANEDSGLVYGKDFVVFSKGDDFSVLYQPYIKDEFIRHIYDTYFLKASDSPDIADTRIYGLGQVCKFLDIGGPSSFKFCSLRSWEVDEQQHVVLTRDPSKLYGLSKYARKTKTYNLAQLYLYLIDQAVSLLQSYKGIKVFDIMAQAYISEAHKLMPYFTNKEHKCFGKYMNNLQQGLKQKVDNSRAHTDINDPVFELPDCVNDIGHRIKQYKIYGNYWDTMKAIEQVNVRRYTKKELNAINTAMSKEFDQSLLRTMLGLKNEEQEC